MKEKKYSYREFREKFFPNMDMDDAKMSEILGRNNAPDEFREKMAKEMRRVSNGEILSIQQWVELSPYLPLPMRENLWLILNELYMLRLQLPSDGLT